MDSRKIGILHEEQCKLYFLSLGYTISVPIGECSHYDFILDTNKYLLKIQCKKSSYQNGVLTFTGFTTKPGISTRYKIKNYDLSDIDYFATYHNNICYLIKYDLDLPNYISLRVEHPKSEASKSKIRWANLHEGSYVINRLNDPDNTTERFINTKEQNIVKHNKYIWITDGTTNKKLFKGDIPEGFRRGRIL